MRFRYCTHGAVACFECFVLSRDRNCARRPRVPRLTYPHPRKATKTLREKATTTKMIIIEKEGDNDISTNGGESPQQC